MSKIDDWLKPGAIVPVNVETTKELVDALREAMKPKVIYHGGPAFPTHLNLTRGMTLRDYFAAKALPCALKQLMHDYTLDDPKWSWDDDIDNDLLADSAYKIADAMLKASEA